MKDLRSSNARVPNRNPKHVSAPWFAHRIEQWPIERLIPYARNPRTHSDAQVAQIAASIREFGFNNPILIDMNAGIIAGHGRLLAARKLELQEVPVIVLDHLTETQKRAYILADNQLALNSGWDDELLRIELSALQEEEFNLDLIGFDDEELARLLAVQDVPAGLRDEDSVPELPQAPISISGDLWILCDHKLLVGDATSAEEVSRLLGGEKADLVFTDPPYNVDYEGYTEQRIKIKGDRMSDTEFKHFLEAALRSYRAVIKAGASLYICHSSSWQREFQNALEAGHGTKFGRKKEEAVAALLVQRNLEDAARAVGISAKTLLRWMKEPEFDAAYREARRAAFGQSVARLQQASGAAVSTLLKIMVDSTAPASTRVRAADSVLDHSAKAIEIEDIEARVAELERAAEGSQDGRR